MDALRAAAAALDDGHGALALERLRAAWAACRQPEVVDVMLTLAGRLKVDPLWGRKDKPKTQKEERLRWAQRARQHRAADFDLLWAGFQREETRGSSHVLAALLDEYVLRPVDPRLGAVAARMIARINGRNADLHARKPLTRWKKLVVANADEAALKTVRGLRPFMVEQADIDRLVAGMERTLAQCQRPLSADAQAMLATVAQRVTTAGDLNVPDVVEEDAGDKLLAAVLADPTSDDAKLVYADWLLANDDDFGELITLQLAGTSRRGARTREAELLGKHHQRMLGSLGSIVLKKGFVAHGGFPREVFLMSLKTKTAALHHHHPEWATVRYVTFDNHVGNWRSFVSAAMRDLRGVRNLCRHGVKSLVKEGRDLPVEEIFIDALDTVGTFDLLRRYDGLARLSVLGAEIYGWTQPLLDFLRTAGTVAPGLQTLVLEGHALDPEPIAEPIQRVIFVTPAYPSTVRIEVYHRNPSGGWRKKRVTKDSPEFRTLPWLGRDPRA